LPGPGRGVKFGPPIPSEAGDESDNLNCTWFEASSRLFNRSCKSLNLKDIAELEIEKVDF